MGIGPCMTELERLHAAFRQCANTDGDCVVQVDTCEGVLEFTPSRSVRGAVLVRNVKPKEKEQRGPW